MRVKVEEKLCFPTKINPAPYLTVYKHLRDGGDFRYYVQISRNKNDPDWVRIGDLLEGFFEGRFLEESFLSSLVSYYEKGRGDAKK